MLSWLLVARAFSADLAAWEGLFAQVPLHEDGESGPRLWLDAHARRDGSRFVGIVRPAVGWDVSARSSFWLGYAWVPSVTDGSVAPEHRVWQQGLFGWKLRDGVTTSLRPRLEQRFAPHADGIGLRARLFGRAQVDVSDRVSLVVSDEIFVRANDSGFGDAGLDQNRLFFGPALRGYEGMRLEIGYLDQRVWTPAGPVVTHVVATNLFLTL
jgi:hypothetical protein